MNTASEIYSEYYFALKRLWELHRQFGFGKSPDIPSGFSERLCRDIFKLEKSKERSHDAIDDDRLRIEIKATGTEVGQTTISKKAGFDYLFWLHFDFEEDCAKIYKIPRSSFIIEGKRDRVSISIGKIAKINCIAPFIYFFAADRCLKSQSRDINLVAQ